VRHPRVYVSVALETGERVSLDARTAHYLARVLRLKAGVPLILFDGRGGEYHAVLLRASSREATVEVGPHRGREIESPLDVCLVQAVSRGERMDYTIQKAVELGARAIAPVTTERCQIRLDETRADKRLQHWQGIVIHACQQCGRNRLPELRPLLPLEQWLEEPVLGRRLVLHPESRGRLKDFPPVGGSVTVLAGPEGGLSDSELARAAAAGYIGVQLGPRILRTETVSVAALAALQALWGDLAGTQESLLAAER
jgi:16S rRNA (uracil1498-N3)-methyltransferase